MFAFLINKCKLAATYLWSNCLQTGVIMICLETVAYLRANIASVPAESDLGIYFDNKCSQYQVKSNSGRMCLYTYYDADDPLIRICQKRVLCGAIWTSLVSAILSWFLGEILGLV